jgi:hypothetical protein
MIRQCSRRKKNELISLTKEGTGGKDGYDERSLRGSNSVTIGEDRRYGNVVTKGFKPVGHLLETRDGTSIIAEQNSTKCSETGLQQRCKRWKWESRTRAPTIRTPAILLLGALAPMPPLMSIGPPGMMCYLLSLRAIQRMECREDKWREKWAVVDKSFIVK